MLEGEVFLCIDRKLDHLFVLSTNFTQSCTAHKNICQEGRFYREIALWQN